MVLQSAAVHSLNTNTRLSVLEVCEASVCVAAHDALHALLSSVCSTLNPAEHTVELWLWTRLTLVCVCVCVGERANCTTINNSVK